jgi:hypothetical protein
MGWEHPPETVWQAQELYCVDRCSFDRVAELTGVSATTLKAWADKYDWRDKREEIAKAESDIRYGTILGRQKVLERLIAATSGMEASQLSFAVSALENLALKRQEMAASGKIPNVAVEKPPTIATRADAVAVLRTAIENKLGQALADPGLVTSATVKDVTQCLALIDELEAGLPKGEAVVKAVDQAADGASEPMTAAQMKERMLAVYRGEA